MVNLYRKLYGSSSLTSKALAFVPYYKVYRNTYKFLKKSQYWDRNQIGKYQTDQLSKLIHHAYNNVPYYNKLFDDNNLTPDDIQSISDLQKIPFLTKEIVRENIDDLKAKNYPEEAFEYVTTGGSTGTPLGFYYEKGVSRAKEWAFMKTQWDRVGYKFTDKCVVLRGNVVSSAKDGKYWEKSFFARWLILSTYHMTDRNLQDYVEEIRKFKPKYIQAYPSAITLLAKYINNNDNINCDDTNNNIKPFPSIKAIFCGSENIYPWQRKLIEDTFKCRVYSWYGNSEQTVLAGECEYSSNYHIFPEYSIVEFINILDGSIPEKETSSIVTTQLENYIFPFIRYDTGDLGQYLNEICKCGRNCSLIEYIDGRKQELIYGNDGSPITLTALFFAQHFDAFSKCKEMQILQQKMGEIKILIVKSKFYSNEDENEIRLKIKKIVNDNLDINFEYVDSISRTQNGKLRFLIQELDSEIKEDLI